MLLDVRRQSLGLGLCPTNCALRGLS